MSTATDDRIEEQILGLIKEKPMKPGEVASVLKRKGIGDEEAGHAIRSLIERREAVPNVEWKLTATK